MTIKIPLGIIVWEKYRNFPRNGDCCKSISRELQKRYFVDHLEEASSLCNGRGKWRHKDRESSDSDKIFK
jgi:hypothetical protein